MNPTTTAFIANLSYDVTEREIVEHFEHANIVATHVRLIHDRETGAPKGFGFAEIDTSIEEARQRLANVTLRGRAMVIRPADRRRA